MVKQRLRLLDGAMGTQLIEKGLRNGEPSILWNATHREDVFGVHQSYADAGSEFLTTNSFGGSTFSLARHGLEKRVSELNRLAAEIAKEAARGRCKILGDIGPSGEFLDPVGDLSADQLSSAVRIQAEALVLGGVDGFIVETMSDAQEVAVTVAALVDFGLPVMASFTFERVPDGFRTMMGCRPDVAVRAAIEAGADAVGANCGTGLTLRDYLELASEIVKVADTAPVLLQPNAGAPCEVDGVFSYSVAPQEFSVWANRALGVGVWYLGGCCGTTPQHIHAVAERCKTQQSA